jgi:hypothetical protein
MSANTTAIATREAAIEEITVLDTWHVKLTRGYTDFPFTGQVTAIRVGHVKAWIRENKRSNTPSFLVSSNARITAKMNGPHDGRQVLELAAPRHHWERIASVVAAADGLDRPVVKHARWTLNTAPASKTWGRGIR